MGMYLGRGILRHETPETLAPPRAQGPPLSHRGRAARALGRDVLVIVKIDEAVSPEEVRAVRLPGELSDVDEGNALQAAHAVIARHVGHAG